MPVGPKAVVDSSLRCEVLFTQRKGHDRPLSSFRPNIITKLRLSPNLVPRMATFFNEYFGVTTEQVEDYDAFNVSIINDLPLFIDPFLIFHSEKSEYQELHNEILRYMIFLRNAVVENRVNDDLERAWFTFSEVK
jgi:hypothetical protein